MLLKIALVGLAFLFGMAAGAWLLVWIGRWADGRSAAVIREIQEENERAAFDRGYAAALGIRAAIDEPADRERSAR